MTNDELADDLQILSTSVNTQTKTIGILFQLIERQDEKIAAQNERIEQLVARAHPE